MFNILKLVLSIVGFSLLIEASFGQGDAPAILKGLNQADKSIGAFIRTPNGQVTKVSSSSALIETGNTNILENPNFEHSVYDTSWIIGSGTSSKVDVNIDNTKVFSGLNALKMTMAASSLDVFNVSPTGNQAFKDGVQGLVSVRVKTTVSGIKVCQRKGFAITTNCVSVVADGKWGLYKVPSILGEFYNGVEITSTPTAVTGDVYIDDAFVGAVDLQATTSFDTTCPTIACETSFSALIVAGGSVQNENVDWISTQSGTATKTANFNGGVFTVAPNCTATLYITASPAMSARVLSTTASAVNLQTPDYNGNLQDGSLSLSCQKQGADYTAAIAARIAYQKTQVASYSSNNADTDWIPYSLTIQATTTAPTKGGVQIDNARWRRKGSMMEIRYQYYQTTAGTAGSGTYLFPFPNIPQCGGQCEVDTTKLVPFKINTGDTPIGYGLSAALGASGKLYPVLPTSALSATWANKAFVLVYSRTGVEDQSPIGSSFYQLTTTNMTYDVFVTFPVKNWSDSNIIIGSFNGLQSCTDTLACTDTFSAKISAAGVVSDENTEWVTGNCTKPVVGRSTCTFETGLFTVAPNCTATWGTDATLGARSIQIFSVSSSAITVSAYTPTVGAADMPFNIICQKQGADYIGKTAMAVASDQNVRSIGSTNVDIQSVIFGTGANCASVCSTGTCSLCSQSGSKITSVTWNATGSYNVNGLDGTKYLCTGGGEGTSYVNAYTRKDLSTSSLVRVQTGIGVTLANSAATIICIGIP